jgi:hypothetical protein
MMTWNVRGYPEKEEQNRAWFNRELSEIKPEVIQDSPDQISVIQ